jgi:hypothetical protein
VKKKLDDIFSLFIRQRKADANGFVKCYTCPTTKHWKEMQNGHYIPRQHMATRYLIINNNPQCKNCNENLRGNLEVYREKLIAEHGLTEVEALEKMKYDTLQMKQSDYKEQIEFYKNKLQTIKQ